MRCRAAEYLRGVKPDVWLWLLAGASIFADFMFHLHLIGNGHIAWYNPLLAIADTALLLSPLLLLPARHRGWCLLPVWAVALWCMVTVLYYVSYGDIMPLRSMSYLSNVDRVLVDSTMGNIREMPQSLLLLVPPVVVTLAYVLRWRRALRDSGGRPRWRAALLAVLPWAACTMAYPYYLMVRYSPQFMIDRERGQAMANDRFKYKLRIFYKGAVRAIADDVARMLPRHLDGSERQRLERFMSRELENDTVSPVGTANRGKNLVVVLVESLNAWAVDIEIDGRPVAPTLRALTSPDSSLCSRRMITQACHGRSSDGMFCYLTGLLPLRHGAVAMDYPQGGYPSLARLAHDNGCRTTGEVSYDLPDVWNVEAMAREYDMDTLVIRNDLKRTYRGHDKLGDTAVYAVAAAQAAVWKKPFMMLVFNISTHAPYDHTFPLTTWISRCADYSPAVRVYLERLHYFDSQLGRFMRRMRDSGLWDNTVFVIVSDHTDPVDEDSSRGRPSLSAAGNECVFAVVNGGVTGEVPGYMGQVDVYPTILDVMGWRGKGVWPGLGNSVLREPASTAVAPDGKQYGTPLSRDLTRKQREAWDISEMLITSGWFAAPHNTSNINDN